MIGLVLYALYVFYFIALWRSDNHGLKWFEYLFAWMALIPASALVTASGALWVPEYLWTAVDLTQWFALGVTWLVLSGTTQALLWYVTSWERPASSS